MHTGIEKGDNMIYNIDKYIGFRNMEDRYFPEYRQKIYTYLKSTLSGVMTDEDLDIIVKLIAELFGDLYMRTKLLPWDINPDRCPDEYLRALSSIVGYRWNEGLTPDQQRESIKLYCLIRKYRGTNFGLSNLIRVFGQDITSFYSSADLRGVEIIEYGSGGAETVEPNMYPGDLKIRIPELSTILTDAIFDTKSAGTRLFFAYYIFMGIYHLKMYQDFAYRIHEWMNMLPQGYSPTIEKYGYKYLNTEIGRVEADQISHTVTRGNMIAGIQLLTYYKAPWINGFILNYPGLTNYRGFIEVEPTVREEHVLYK